MTFVIPKSRDEYAEKPISVHLVCLCFMCLCAYVCKCVCADIGAIASLSISYFEPYISFGIVNVVLLQLQLHASIIYIYLFIL